MAGTANKSPLRVAALAERAAFTELGILDAAEEIFAHKGLQGARVRDIADAAGVNVATLYNYYKNKSALYEAVLERGIQPVTEVVKNFSLNVHDNASAREAIQAIMTHLSECPNVSRLIYLETVTEGDYLKTLANKWLRPLIEEILAALAADRDATDFDESIAPFLSALFIHLSFGHFALAPLLKEVLGHDPLAPEGIRHQSRFIEMLIQQIFPKAKIPDQRETPN